LRLVPYLGIVFSIILRHTLPLLNYFTIQDLARCYHPDGIIHLRCLRIILSVRVSSLRCDLFASPQIMDIQSIYDAA
jgi:hypothetical protein